MPPKKQEKTYVGLPIHQLTKPLKMTNTTSTDVIFTGALKPPSDFHNKKIERLNIFKVFKA